MGHVGSVLGESGDVEGLVTVVEIDCLDDDLLPNENQESERESTVIEDDTDVSEATVERVSERLNDFSFKANDAVAGKVRVVLVLSDTRASHGLVLSNVSRSSS